MLREAFKYWMKQKRRYLKDLIPVDINKLVLYDGSFEYSFNGNTLSLVPENYGKRCFLSVFINGIRQQMSWDLHERPHRGRLKYSQIPYRNETVFYVIGGDGRRYRHLFLCPVTMFDLPSLEGVEEVVISKEVVEGIARPLYIYADRADRAGDASAS